MICPRNLRPLVVACTSVAAWLTLSQCFAAVIYVDNHVGNDAYLGFNATPGGETTGPVKSISRALRLAQAGDTIEIKNTGIPYHESFVLFGPRHSGYTSQKFMISGNGAVIDGSSPVPADSWVSIGSGLWKITPWRKGHYGLILNDQPVPVVAVPVAAHERPDLPVGHWCAWRGSIYYHADGIADPPSMGFRFAHLGMGLTLYRVENVVIRDLTFRNFRVDGINAPDLSHDILLENVKSIDNGRSGLFVGGTAALSAAKSDFIGNRQTQVLIRGLGVVRLEETNISEPPVEID
ncbi:MAG: right-handed parallel beta-helix repeat-containing protein [Planctomycetaceae bacterium]